MGISVFDSEAVPVPPEETRILALDAELWPDGRRVTSEAHSSHLIGHYAAPNQHPSDACHSGSPPINQVLRGPMGRGGEHRVFGRGSGPGHAPASTWSVLLPVVPTSLPSRNASMQCFPYSLMSALLAVTYPHRVKTQVAANRSRKPRG
jgi:hypothetical protein